MKIKAKAKRAGLNESEARDLMNIHGNSSKSPKCGKQY